MILKFNSKLVEEICNTHDYNFYIIDEDTIDLPEPLYIKEEVDEWFKNGTLTQWDKYVLVVGELAEIVKEEEDIKTKQE